MFNVVTSMGRFNNAKALIKHLEPQKIHWHVIMDDDAGCHLTFDDPWITTYLCPNREKEFWARCHFALSWFLGTQQINDDEMYCFLNDDDGYEPDFFQKVKQTMADVEKQHGKEPDVVIVSMMRGDKVPVVESHRVAHSIDYLPAHPDNVQVGGIGMEQYIVRGKIAKQYQFPNHICGDGMYIMQIFRDHGAVFAPFINAWFNYFEPGRWNWTINK